MKLKSGHEVVPTTSEETKRIQKYFPAYKNGAIRLYPGGWFFLPTFPKYADKLYDFKFRPTDVVVSTYPKSGTTWTQDILWTMMHDRNYDNEKSKVEITLRAPFLEYDFIRESTDGFQDEEYQGIDLLESMCGKKIKEGVLLEIAEHTPDPRLIKTHLGFSLLNPNMLDTCKVIYVSRNPKDVFLSYLHHHCLFKRMTFLGDTSEFLDFFINDTVLHSPYWQNVKDAWERRNHKNLLWIHYENMKKDPMNEIKRINEFLGADMSDKELTTVLEHTKFENMLKRNTVTGTKSKAEMASSINHEYHKENGGFFRKGKTGGWKNELNEDQIYKLDKWINTKSEEIGVSFNYS